MMKILEALSKVVPFIAGLLPDPEASHEELHVWRLRIVFCQIFAFFIIGGLVASSYMAFSTFVSADELDLKIQKAVKPIEQKVDSLDLLVRQQLAVTLSTQIRDARRRWCAAAVDSSDRERTQQDIDRLQDEYFRVKGERYSVLPCAELNGR